MDMVLADNVKIQEFYERIKKTYEGNNHIYRVKVIFDDGTSPVTMIYQTPKGFEENQNNRKGTIELLLK